MEGYAYNSSLTSLSTHATNEVSNAFWCLCILTVLGTSFNLHFYTIPILHVKQNTQAAFLGGGAGRAENKIR